MTASALRHVRASGLHDQQEVAVDLRPGLNIIYGDNGSGKTTFLHILANLAERDLERFCHIRFGAISVRTYDGTEIGLTQHRPSDNPNTTIVQIRVGDKPIGAVRRGEITPREIRSALQDHIGGRPVYLPAFRSVLEAIGERSRQQYASDPQRDQEIRRIIEREHQELREEVGTAEARSLHFPHDATYGAAYKTVLCREWFGSFVPTVRFPSLAEVAEQLGAEVQGAQIAVANIDRRAFSDVFVKVLRAVLSGTGTGDEGDVESVLASIRESLGGLQEAGTQIPNVYQEIASLLRADSTDFMQRELFAARILRVYDQALRERIVAQRRAYLQIKTFESSVNRFLRHKRLVIDTAGEAGRRHAARIQLQGGRSSGLSVLSSGERHVLTLLFSATHMSTAEGMLLIDEPELSLHVDWQRIILSELMKQAGDRQIIACTHAPEVTADHRDAMTGLGTQYWTQGALFPDQGAQIDG
jgi:predicted ATPase